MRLVKKLLMPINIGKNLHRRYSSNMVTNLSTVYTVKDTVKDTQSKIDLSVISVYRQVTYFLDDYCNICVLGTYFLHHSNSVYAVLESTNNNA